MMKAVFNASTNYFRQYFETLSGISYLSNIHIAIDGSLGYQEWHENTTSFFGLIKHNGFLRYNGDNSPDYYKQILGPNMECYEVQGSEELKSFAGTLGGHRHMGDGEILMNCGLHYKGTIKPSEINRFSSLKAILDNSKSNDYIKTMVAEIVSNTTYCESNKMPNEGGISLRHGYLGDFSVNGKYYYFADFRLQNIKDYEHNEAINAILLSSFIDADSSLSLCLYDYDREDGTFFSLKKDISPRTIQNHSLYQSW